VTCASRLTLRAASLSLRSPPSTSTYSTNRSLTHAFTSLASRFSSPLRLPASSSSPLTAALVPFSDRPPTRSSRISLINTRCSAQIALCTTSGEPFRATATSSRRGFGSDAEPCRADSSFWSRSRRAAEVEREGSEGRDGLDLTALIGSDDLDMMWARARRVGDKR
jgi:hypothetical protein